MRQVDASQWDLFTLKLEPRGSPEPFVTGPLFAGYPAFSPDGRWVAYESAETGPRQVHVRPYPGLTPRVTVSTTGGRAPFWSHDGRELFYLRGQEVWSAAVLPGSEFRHGPPQHLFAADFLPTDTLRLSLSAAPDGKRFLAVRPQPRERAERLLVYAPNWIEEVER